METISRRAILQGAVLGVAASAMAASAVGAAQAQEEQEFERSVDWSAEYDVVVIGSGFAGFTAAASAADAGARVLVVEKAPFPLRGGNSRYAYGAFFGCKPENREAFEGYISQVAAACDNPDAAMISAFTEQAMQIIPWFNERGGDFIQPFSGGAYVEYAGHDALDYNIANAPIYSAAHYNQLANYVDALDTVEVWYDTPAIRLIQDPATRMIHGVTVEHDGATYNVRALDGVVLAAGGFEANPTMVQTYVHLPYAYPKGTLYNTGDGIKMAMAVGADLWSMGATSGPDLDVVNEATGQSYAGGALRMRGYNANPLESSGFTLLSAIIVGADGTRFCDESYLPDHGYMDFHGRKITSPYSLPAYVVFDKVAFEQPIYPIWGTNQEKVDEGVIVQADTLEELAKAINLPEDSLTATVQTYNEACASGVDQQFGRNPEYLTALATEGPYYAVEVKPTFINTQGGPRRNTEAEIIDVWGEPIPHLYGAGECGSMWGDVYPGGGNLTECFAFGRIAGDNAAAPKDDNLRENLLASTEMVSFAQEPPTFSPETDNEFIGVGEGIGGKLYVKIVVDSNAITDVQVIHNYETPGIGDKAVAALPQRILGSQSADVDIVAGASASSRAILAAAADAMAHAGLV